MGSITDEQIRQEIEEEGQEHFHVLAVDDSLIERKMLEKLLTISSYQVTCVESGDKALEYLGLVDHTRPHIDDDDHIHHENSNDDSTTHQYGQGMRVNLIMTDYSMPGISGYDLLKRVKGSSWKDVPVVVMSSENVPSRIDMCLEGGAEDFLLKPVRLSDLKKLQPHILKTTTSTSQYCCEKNSTDNSKDSSAGSSSNLVAKNGNINNDTTNYDYNKQGILIDDYPNNFDKGKTRVDDDHFDIDRGPKSGGINYSVNVFS